jgi:hypothetical protein
MGTTCNVGLFKFFRSRLLTLSYSEILSEIKKMETEQKALKHELYKFCWYMRGGMTIEEAYYSTYEDREIIGAIVKENLETTKKTNLPYF